MIPRYDVPEISSVWSDEARLGHWLEIELLAVEAWSELGVVPAADAAVCRDRASFTVEAVLERERVTRHDIAAFVDVVAGSVGEKVGGSTTASRRATCSTRRSACSWARPPTCCSRAWNGCSPW